MVSVDSTNLFKLAPLKLAFSYLLASFIFCTLSLSALAENNSSAEIKNLTMEEKNAEWYSNQVIENARNNPSYAVSVAEKALSYLSVNADPIAQAKVLNESSYALYFLARYPEAMQRAKAAEVFAQNHKLVSEVARARLLQANVLQEIGAHQQAVNLYRQAAQYYRESNNKQKLAGTFQNIANTYFAAEQFDSALDFYQQSSKYASSDVYRAKFNLGYANTYGVQGKADLSIEHFKLALEFYKKSNDQLGQELALSGMGRQLNIKNRHREAIGLFDQALKSAQEGNRIFRVFDIYVQKSQSLLRLGEIKESLLLVDLALEKAKESGSKAGQVDAYVAKMDIYEKIGDFDLFLKAQKISLKIAADYKSSVAKTRLAVMQAILEVEKKDHQIDLLSSENKVQQLKIEQQKIAAIAVVGGLLFIITVVAFFFYRKTQARLLAEQKSITKRLEQLNELKTRLLANTSHELRTPLNGIIGMTQILLDDTSDELSKDNSEFVKIIEQCGKRLLHLIEDILDLTQLQANQMAIRSKIFRIEPVIKEACQLLDSLAKEKGLTINYQIESDEIEVLADPKRLHQILNNIIGNAIKFSDQGNILIKVYQLESKVEISVKDQGEGIPAENMDMIFEPFAQVDDSSKRAHDGSGLGLTITKELLLLHDSDIEVLSLIHISEPTRPY